MIQESGNNHHPSEQEDAFLKGLGIEMDALDSDTSENKEPIDQDNDNSPKSTQKSQEASEHQEHNKPSTSKIKLSKDEVSATSKLLSSYITPTIADDYYSAKVKLIRSSGEAIFGINHIKEFLNHHEIRYGIIDEKIYELIDLIKHGPVGKELVIAKGSHLVEGKDGICDYKFRTKLIAGKMGEDKIDFRERGSVNNVRAGQIIGKITAEIPGKPGMQVDGEVIKAKAVKAVKIPSLGMNVSVFHEDNTFTYTAQVAGHARLFFNEIQVNPDFIIPGDLDYKKGNIDFVGNVEVLGTVKSGFKINAGGDVMIRGDVESDAIIISEKDITVKRSINCGKNPGKIVAGGNISSYRIVNSLIKAKGDVFVKDQIIETTVKCEGKFASSWGKIIGCEIEAISGIFANDIGVKGGNTTNRIHAGKTYGYIEKLAEIEKELEKVNNELALLAKGIATESNPAYQDKDFAKLDVREQDRIKRMGIARSKMTKSLKESKEKLEKEKQDLLAKIKENRLATIEIKGFIHPTCYLKIGDNDLKILDKKKDACILQWNLESTSPSSEQNTAEPIV